VIAAAIPGQALGADFSHDFRGSRMPAADLMTLTGVDTMSEITPEEGGLRIKVQPGRGKDGVGIQTRFPLTGDFEITASYEILSADKPTTGYGVGFNLMIAPVDWKNKRAILARYWTAQGGSGLQAIIMLKEPKPFQDAAWEPAETMKGQLRLRREGERLSYLVNEDLGKPFREMFRFDYGADEVHSVRFVANPGRSPVAVDMRLLDVQIHWDGPPPHAALALAVAVVEKSQAAEAPRGRRLWPLLLVFFLATCIGLLAVYLVQRRNKKGVLSPKM
jgi:hypothetical protein